MTRSRRWRYLLSHTAIPILHTKDIKMPMFIRRAEPEEAIQWTGDNFTHVSSFLQSFDGAIAVQLLETGDLDIVYCGDHHTVKVTDHMLKDLHGNLIIYGHGHFIKVYSEIEEEDQ